MTNPFVNIELSNPSISPINFYDLQVSEFLTYFYRQLKTTVEEEGFEVVEKNKSFFSELDAHVYTMTQTDYKKYHAIKNHKFLEAIDMLKPLNFKALSSKIEKEELNFKIAKNYYSVNLANLKLCKELQSNCFLNQF